MKCCDVVGVAYDGACYCEECSPVTADEADEEGNGGPLFAGDECDYQRTCDVCGEELPCTVLGGEDEDGGEEDEEEEEVEEGRSSRRNATFVVECRDVETSSTDQDGGAA